ncbi:MAG: long-chain-fatty-acid--CoA ligase [Salinisphaeraceae bacterium]|nr:long-chain-fatty-acid--CoA ligase [Salinisphaeraceae bacterium]
MHRPWLDQYPAGVEPRIDMDRYASVAAVLEESCQRFAPHCAFENLGSTLSYADLDRHSRHFAAYLQSELGLKKGDRLALMMPNCLQHVVALFAGLRSGLVIVSVNPLYTARELEFQLQDSGARAIVIFENFACTLEKVEDSVPVEHIVTTRMGDMLGPVKGAVTNFFARRVKKMVPEWDLPDPISFSDALTQGEGLTLAPVALTHSDVALLQYTGGTTGPARGAVLSHGNLVANILQTMSWFSDSLEPEREIIVTALPIYHIFALMVNVLIFLHIGGRNLLITNPADMPAFVKELRRHRFTAITGVNTLFNGLLNTPGFEQIDFSALKFAVGGGSAIRKAVADRWQAATGQAIIEGYGLSETSPVVTCNLLNSKDFNHSIGLPLPATEVVIRGEENQDLPEGETGELCVKGPQVMLGYWQGNASDSDTFTTDGYLKTGDMARMDESGFFYLVDRKKDVILVSGFNVFPNEIEEVIASHEAVLEGAAVGVPDEKTGEAVKLFVVRKDEALTAEEVREHCRAHLTAYKVPKHIEFIQEIPKSNVGKVLRKELR